MQLLLGELRLPLWFLRFEKPPSPALRFSLVACGLQLISAVSYTIPRLNARIPAHHAVILRYGRTFLQTVHPMLKKLFQSFRSPKRHTQHIRSTPEVLNSGQHSLQKAQFSRYAVNIVERLQDRKSVV